MEVTLPYRLHHHQNGPLHNAIAKTRNAQWPHFAVRFRNQYTPRWQRVVRPRQQLRTDRRKFSVEMLLHLCLVDAVDARRLGSAGGQRNTSRFPEPSSVGDQPQETVELAFIVLRRPCRQFALHFTDYQRSSPHCGQLIDQANHLNCPPSPCGRISRSRTTTEAPPACTSSGAHSLGICANLPQFTCWTQRMGEVAYRSLYPCFPQVGADVMA